MFVRQVDEDTIDWGAESSRSRIQQDVSFLPDRKRSARERSVDKQEAANSKF
jgi:hypothetical protein